MIKIKNEYFTINSLRNIEINLKIIPFITTFYDVMDEMLLD
jgi:hypothetical protein